jgi:hypothetical protein
VGLQILTPPQPGLWHVTLSLSDGNGRLLASLGAATATFDITTHSPYLLKAASEMPTSLHRGEASLLVTRYTALPASGTTDHPLVLAWRALDAAGRVAAEGTSAVGTLAPGSAGTFFSVFVAPRLTGTYKLSYELREGDVAVTETTTTTVTIFRRRTYPDDEGGRTPGPQTVFPAPAATRVPFPSPSQSLVPRLNLPPLPTANPRGKPTPPR